MNESPPKLIAISGPLKGQVCELGAQEISIGRESSNDVAIGDISLSRRHCRVTNENGRIKLTDLSSLNGTFVNDSPIKERWLEHGDRVRLGDSIFLFVAVEEDAPAASDPVNLSDDSSMHDSTFMLRREEAIYLNTTRLHAALPPESRIARDLNTLISLSAAINGAKSIVALQRQLLELLGAAVPAKQGAVLLADDDSTEFESVFGWDRERGVERAITVSRTIAQQVLREGVSLMSNDKLPDPSASFIASGAHSIMAVPLTVMERNFGVIWLATSDPLIRFDQAHLQLVTAAASIAAIALDNLRRVERLESENRRLLDEISLSHNMIGESRRMEEIYQLISRVAPTDSTVLIRGESGCGKELVARAIHQNSARANSPFIAINCAALTETLLESELFGHEKGAFTGAIAQKKGKLEIAQGGTLFLDEMGELALSLQAKLLRVLQEREFERVGGTRTIKTDIRLIAATNRDLEAAIREGGFRQDLYYRLNVVTLTLPPLRERREDIPLLATYFAAKYGEKCKRPIRGLTPEARAAMMAYDWPGNVRELENAVERAVVLGVGELIQLEDLPETLLESESQTGAPTDQYHEAIRETKKRLILNAFAQAQGNYTEAAKLLGVHPNYLHRLIRNLNLKPLLEAGK